MIVINNEHIHVVHCEKNEVKAFSPEASRTITFAPELDIRPTLHVFDYTADEIDACWFTREEKYEIKNDNRHTIQLIGMGCPLDDEGVYCERGLEHIGARTRLERMTQARDAVLHEQQMQANLGAKNAYIIATSYQNRSFPSKMDAYLLGVSDETSAGSIQSAPSSEPKGFQEEGFNKNQFPPRKYWMAT
jgi:hypothetical protein